MSGCSWTQATRRVVACIRSFAEYAVLRPQLNTEAAMKSRVAFQMSMSMVGV
jgi:hypothetical protein